MSSRRRTPSKGGGTSSSRGNKRSRFDLAGRDDDDDSGEDDHTPNVEDEDLDSDVEVDGVAGGMDEDESEEEEETLDAKRLRMAREYLSKVEKGDSSDEDESGEDSEGDDNQGDKVGERLANERLRKSGLLQIQIADSVLLGVQKQRGEISKTIGIEAASRAYLGGDGAAEADAKSWLNAKYVTYYKGHDLTPTCVSLTRDGETAFSASKDGSILSWDVEVGKKRSCLVAGGKNFRASEEDRSQREVLALSISDDGRYMAAGGRDNAVRIFDVRTTGKSGASPVATLRGHKKAVTALAFRRRALDLYSGSEDRCIRRYDLNAMTYVETLYGHQAPIVSIDCANKNRPVSVGRDRTTRVWKVEEDSHLVFRPGGDVGSAECASAIKDGWFVSGHDDGRLALWRDEKKRPIGDAIVAAHGYEAKKGSVTRGVVCCNALGLSDVLATGSNDGYLRLWRVNTEDKGAGIEPLESIPIHGYINSIAMGPHGRFCVAAVGQEHRLGRWDRVARAKNRFAIIKLDGK